MYHFLLEMERMRTRCDATRFAVPLTPSISSPGIELYLLIIS